MKSQKICFDIADGKKTIEYQIIKESTILEPDISIIIRTKNEENKIDECLSIINSQLIDYRYEIIIIDSGSEDRTIDIAKKYDTSIYIINSKDFNFGTSISLGINLSKGNFCTFLSAHAIPKDNYWLSNLINKFDDGVAAVYSRQTFKNDAFFIEQRSLDETFGKTTRIQEWKSSYKRYSDYKSNITFSNASSCIKKDVALKIPFREILASEDREWAYRVLKAGWKIVYASDSIVYHYHNEDIKKYYKRIYINAKSLYEFTGVHINWYHCLFLVFLNNLKNYLYLKRRKLPISIKELKISNEYSKKYVKAHYDATRKEI